MTIIYSDSLIEGVSGTYVSPRYFDKDNLESADAVYAKDEAILNAYKDKGVEVIDLVPKKKTTK